MTEPLTKPAQQSKLAAASRTVLRCTLKGAIAGVWIPTVELLYDCSGKLEDSVYGLRLMIYHGTPALTILGIFARSCAEFAVVGLIIGICCALLPPQAEPSAPRRWRTSPLFNWLVCGCM